MKNKKTRSNRWKIQTKRKTEEGRDKTIGSSTKEIRKKKRVNIREEEKKRTRWKEMKETVRIRNMREENSDKERLKDKSN